MTLEEHADVTDLMAARFVDALDGTEHPALLMGAAFRLIDIVVQHIPPECWDEAEKQLRAGTKALIRRMRGGDVMSLQH
jgi:hypothetical protein